MPKNDQMDLKTLESMVQDVNATQVSPEERLSDHVYAYDAKEEKKQERPFLKERLAQKKDVVAKNEANREPRQMNKDRGAQALA